MKRAIVTDYKRSGLSLKTIGKPIFGILKLLGFLLRGLFPALPLMALIAVFLLPQTPHLRVSYTYRKAGIERIYLDCRYLGIYGFCSNVSGHNCPLIAFIKKRGQS